MVRRSFWRERLQPCPLLNYFRERSVWLAEADSPEPELPVKPQDRKGFKRDVATSSGFPKPHAVITQPVRRLILLTEQHDYGVLTFWLSH